MAWLSKMESNKWYSWEITYKLEMAGVMDLIIEWAGIKFIYHLIGDQISHRQSRSYP